MRYGFGFNMIARNFKGRDKMSRIRFQNGQQVLARKLGLAGLLPPSKYRDKQVAKNERRQADHEARRARQVISG